MLRQAENLQAARAGDQARLRMQEGRMQMLEAMVKPAAAVIALR